MDRKLLPGYPDLYYMKGELLLALNGGIGRGSGGLEYSIDVIPRDRLHSSMSEDICIKLNCSQLTCGL